MIVPNVHQLRERSWRGERIHKVVSRVPVTSPRRAINGDCQNVIRHVSLTGYMYTGTGRELTRPQKS